MTACVAALKVFFTKHNNKKKPKPIKCGCEFHDRGVYPAPAAPKQPVCDDED